MKMLKQLLEAFDVKTLLAYARAQQANDFLGPVLFPTKTVDELTFEYFKELNRLPVMATVQAYGAETPIASREGLDKVSGEIPPIKRKIPLNERHILALRREGLGDFARVVDAVYGDLDKMLASVRSRMEAMRIEAISTGKLTLAENGVIMTVDYGVPSNHKEVLESTDLWSAASTAVPIDDIQEWVDEIVNDTGIRPTRALTSNTVVANLLKSVQIRKMIHGTDGATRPVTLAEVNQMLLAMELPAIATYDSKLRKEAATGTTSTERFLPADRFVLMPSDPLGETLLGPTAEALMSDVSEISGMFAQVYAENDPPVVWTKAAATAIPTMPMADAIFIATVLDLS